ncbi:hypothetical protein D0Z03_001740 [Geotrichum reessii]|nr:hypothetical protein D0Z03_001740 [Galactomyces reessii]
MKTPPFTVRAVYPYESDVDGDLTFEANQLITVEVIEDSEWYTGSFTDPKTKQLKSGMFPINFVETITEEAESQEEPVPVSEPEVISPPISAPDPISVSVPVSAASQPESKRGNPVESPEITTQPIAQLPTSNNEPTSHSESTAAPKKRNAFQDRIAAFNSSNIAPTPFAQPKPTSFVKKPFYAAPTNSYVPQIPHIPKPAKPAPPQVPAAEIVHYNDDANEDEKPVPKVSLKDRIRLLQEQQQAEAARAEALAAKKKQKKAAKKVEHDDIAAEYEETAPSSLPVEVDVGEQESLEPTVTGGSLARTLSVGSAASREDAHTDAQPKHHHEIQSVPEQPEPKEIDSNEDEDEDSEEDEEDEEEARKQALRERMAKISGGMGMHLGMIMPGGFGASASSKKHKKKKVEEESESTEYTQAPVPIFPFANPASMPEVLQHPPRAETKSDQVEEQENLSDESESDVVERDIPGEETLTSKPFSDQPRSNSITELDHSHSVPSIPEASSLISSVVPPEPKESVPVTRSSQLPPPSVPQEQSVQIPTAQAPSVLIANRSSISSPAFVAPSSDVPISSPSVPTSERKLDSVIASHKEDSDSEESDSAWSDAEPSRTAQRPIPPILAPPPPPPVSSKETDISGKIFN